MTDDAADVATYDSYIKDCADRAFRDPADSPIILNRSPSHASVLIARLIESGTASIALLTGDLVEGVWGPTVVGAVRRFLGGDPARQIRVLLDNSKRARVENGKVLHPGLIEMRSDGGYSEDAYERQVAARIVPPQIANLYKFHFLVVDARSFRYEQDKAQFDAFARFNAREQGELLVARFNDIWDLSETR